MRLVDIPKDSLLHHFCHYLSATEVPLSYQIACGLSAIGCLLRRQRWVDQVDWRVFPNQSVLVIGPSGIGKDTIINRTKATIKTLGPISRVQVVGGTTMEGINARLADLGRPACAYIPAPEITAFFGKADYQANLLTGMTDLLSGGDSIDIATKGDYLSNRARIISEPTVTMHAGSTVEWLHKNMPEGTLEGGFLGRFLLVPEEFSGKMVALVKQHWSRAQLQEFKQHLQAWHDGLEVLLARCQRPREMILLPDAEDLYTNWYHNRFRMFSRAVMPYANRSRDMVLRLAMLLALSRMHDRYVEGADVAFGIAVLAEVAAKIDSVILPPSREAQLGQKILEMLPATAAAIYKRFGLRWSIVRDVKPALEALVNSRQCLRDGSGKYVAVVEEMEGE